MCLSGMGGFNNWLKCGTGSVNNQLVAVSDTDGVDNIFVALYISATDFRWQYPRLALKNGFVEICIPNVFMLA